MQILHLFKNKEKDIFLPIITVFTAGDDSWNDYMYLVQ